MDFLIFYVVSCHFTGNEIDKVGPKVKKTPQLLPVFIKVNVKTEFVIISYFRNLNKNIEAARHHPVLLSLGFMGLTRTIEQLEDNTQ